MTLQEYQEGVCSLYGDFPIEFGSFYTSLGIVSSVGDLSKMLMNVLSKPDGKINIDERKYLGILLSDIMANLAITANCLGIQLEDVGEMSLTKLTAARKREHIQNDDIFRK